MAELSNGHCLYVLVCVLLSSLLPVIWGCGGSWYTNRYNSLIIDSSEPRYTECLYNGQSRGITPTDIREDTEYLRLYNHQLIDGNLSTADISQQVTRLLALDLYINQLTKMPDLSMFSSSLTYISMNRNQLTDVNLNAFTAFANLRTIILSSNYITNITLSKPITAKYIYLDYNQLAQIDIFSVVPNLLYLTLRSNPLVDFIYPTSDGTAKLETLHLGYTQAFAENYEMHNLSTIRTLDLEQTGIAAFNLSHFINLPNLESLTLSRNTLALYQMPNGSVFPSLKTLRLSYCNLVGEFNLTLVSSPVLPELLTLELVSNQLHSMTLDSGYALEELTYLNVERNAFTEMDLDFYIRATPRLTSLYLRNNQITQITFPGNGTYHPTLKFLYLEYNPLISISDYCLPVFQGSMYVRIYLRGTNLRCDACILWLVSCQYNVQRDNPNCASPNGLKGQTLTAVTPYLIDIPCSGEAEDGAFFEKEATHANGNPTVTIETSRGVQECALRTKLSQSASFYYNATSHFCHIYKTTGGTFTLN